MFYKAAITVIDSFVLGIILNIPSPNKIGRIQGIIFILGFLDLVKFGLGKEPLVGEQGLIYSPQLVDTQLGIGDPAPSLIFPLLGPGKGHKFNDLLENKIPEPDPV